MGKYWPLVVFIIIQVVTGDNTVLGKVLESPKKDAPEPQPYFGFPVKQYAKIAREIVHHSNETYLATIASTKPLKGYPVIDKFRVADSVLNESSTGHINFFIQKDNPVFANIKKKNEVSAMFSNETKQFNNETSEWEVNGNRIFIIGYVAQVPFNTTDGNGTMAAIVSRHPDAVPVLGRLNTILCRLEIEQVCFPDEPVGQYCLTADDYYYADVDE